MHNFRNPKADTQIPGSHTVGPGIMLFLISGYASLLTAEASVVAPETEGQILANLVG